MSPRCVHASRRSNFCAPRHWWVEFPYLESFGAKLHDFKLFLYPIHPFLKVFTPYSMVKEPCGHTFLLCEVCFVFSSIWALIPYPLWQSCSSPSFSFSIFSVYCFFCYIVCMVAMGTCQKKGGGVCDCSGSNFCSYYPYQPKKPYLEALVLKLFDLMFFARLFSWYHFPLKYAVDAPNSARNPRWWRRMYFKSYHKSSGRPPLTVRECIHIYTPAQALTHWVFY